MTLLKRDRTMALAGVLTGTEPLVGTSVIAGRRSLARSAIGGMAETQGMLDFCAGHGIVSDVEVVPIQAVNEAFDRLSKRRQISLCDRAL